MDASLRFFCLISAIIIYGALGSPTPNHPGMIEAVIGVLLVLAVQAHGAGAVFFPSGFQQEWKNAARLALTSGLIIGFGAGAARGHDVTLILRDIIPFVFLFLPLLLSDLLEGRRDRAWILLGAVVIAGLLFALRSMIDAVYNFGGGGRAELTYFANAPGVLLSAYSLIVFSAIRFLHRYDIRSLLLFLLALSLASLPVMAMGLALQRASLGFLVLGLGVLWLAGWRSMPPRRMMVFSVIMMTLSVPFVPLVFILLDVIQAKTAVYGLNMRAEEWGAVWREISHSPWSLMFGKGWGGTFASPAVAGVTVNFTHSLLSSALLKTGVLGLLTLGLYLLGILQLWARLLNAHFIVALGLAGPLLIDIFLYASYKSLDFGLLLLLIPAFSALKAPAQLHPRPSYSIQNQVP